MTSHETILVGAYDYRLVALSVVIAILAAYAALDLAGRVTSSRGTSRMLWLHGGAVAMGFGIWSMHYIGMLAFRLPTPVKYDWPTVLLSLVTAILASGVALFVVSRKKMGVVWAGVGSLVMGGGIASMYYIGMAAMRAPAMCTYSVRLVALSIVLAVVISFVALCLTFRFRNDKRGWGLGKAISAVVMGAAIPAMHYTGMAAASFMPAAAPRNMSQAIGISSLGIVGITAGTLLVLGLVFLTSEIDRRLSLQAFELDSSRRYLRIIDTAFDAFVGMSSDGRITDWNVQAENIFGWSRSEALGQSFSQILCLDGSAQQQGLGVFPPPAGAEDSPWLNVRLELNARHRNGSEIPVELAISKIPWRDSHLFAAFLGDITRQTQLAQEQEKARQAAEASNRAKSEFLANMSHEIRTPLNGVIGMTDLALDTDLTREQREYLETVKLSADSLLTVINDILDFSKIEARKIEMESTDFDLRECLESMLKTLAVRADEKGIELLCEVAPDVPEILKADSSRLRQVAVNLVGNAIKFTDQGEVALQVRVDGQTGEECLLHFSISDTGEGIPAAKLNSVFDAFSQADTSATRKYGGTGLGLTISKRLVEMMGGAIWAESEIGRGSVFHFTARMKKCDPKEVKLGNIAPPELLANVKVLIVDDNKTNRRILEGMLSRWQMKPSSVTGGEEALVELARAKTSGDPYRLVLTDMHMPSMDGFTLIERIRQRPELSTATIMMLTSAGHYGDSTRCKELGVSAYLLKPIRQSELREAIARVLGAPEQDGAIPLITRYSLRDLREPGGSLQILVAEDNAVNQRLIVRLLEKRGHRVTLASNGREALDILARANFHVILMDVQMPEMDGIEATVAIRELEKGTGAHQPIIALTAHAMKGDREKCLASGMDGYLSKPIRPQELDDVLVQYVARSVGSASAAAPEPAASSTPSATAPQPVGTRDA